MIVVFALSVAVAVCVIAVWRTRTEPRRLSNAFWLLAGGMLLINGLGSIGLMDGSLLFFLIALLALLSPLLVLVLGAFLILNGVVMLRRERASLANSLSLLAGLLIIVLVAGTIPVLLSAPLWVKAGWLFGLLVAGYLGFQFVAFVGYAGLYGWLVRDHPAEWVMVLGSGLRAGSEVPPLLASRVRAGMTEFARRRGRILIMSGGKGSDEQVPEAEAMARWAVDNGADPTVLRTEIESRNTEQNLRFSSALVLAEQVTPPAGPGLIVTSNYHVLRAAILARKLGIAAQAAGAPTADYYWPSAMIREFVAILREQRLVHTILVLIIAIPLPLALLLAGIPA
ncbi:YdcF family protein [Microlunatus speluncae]|uniref:YdcF family protein n=1 Tax=Microlunatus speluncae TaxID=2594267 RepID=UPI001266576F|nr:YdcF family protein [Microlunatus speluncae]